MNCLERAASLVLGDRGRDYGHPADDFGAVSRAAKELGVNPHSGPLHHALYMVLVKVRRLVQTPDHHDSIVDGPGYFLTYEMILEREKEYDNQRLHLDLHSKKTNPENSRMLNFSEGGEGGYRG